MITFYQLYNKFLCLHHGQKVVHQMYNHVINVTTFYLVVLTNLLDSGYEQKMHNLQTAWRVAWTQTRRKNRQLRMRRNFFQWLNQSVTPLLTVQRVTAFSLNEKVRLYTFTPECGGCKEVYTVENWTSVSFISHPPSAGPFCDPWRG